MPNNSDFKDFVPIIKKIIKNQNKEIKEDMMQNAYIRIIKAWDKISVLPENEKIKYTVRIIQNSVKRSFCNEIRNTKNIDPIDDKTIIKANDITQDQYIEAKDIYKLIDTYCQNKATINEKKYLNNAIGENSNLQNFWESSNKKHRNRIVIPNYIKCRHAGLKANDFKNFKTKFKKFLKTNGINVN